MSSFDAISPGGLSALAPKVFFLALFILFILYNLYRWLLPKPLPDIPFDSKSAKSLWGDIPSLLGHPVGLNIWTGEHLAKLGAPIGQVLMGPLSKPVVLVADFGDARNMLMSTNDFDRADYIIDRFPLLGGFHFRLKTGSEWKAWRQILQDLMAPRFLHDTVGPIIYRDVIQLIDVWTTKTRLAPNRPFSVVRDLQDVSIDVMVSSLFGKDFEDLAMRRHAAYFADKPIVEFGRTEAIFPRPKVHSFLEELAELANIISSLYAPANWSPKLSSWWLKHVSHRSAFISRDNTIRSYIQRSVQRLGREEPKSGIDHMIAREEKAASKSYRQPAFESQTMVDEIYGNSVAGEHTTAAALTWTVKFMTDYPQVQEKLREELQVAYQQAVQEQRLPTVAEMVATKVPYLEAVLEESLRLRAAFLVPRDTVRDTTLLGHHIPKGTTVLLVAQAPDFSSVPITRNPERYQNFKPTAANDARYQYLQEFQPERWLSKNEAGQFEFDGVFRPQLAFGLGPRGCWGRRLVILEMRMALTMLLWKFDFLPTPPSLSSHDGTYDITFRAKQGFVCLRLRN